MTDLLPEVRVGNKIKERVEPTLLDEVPKEWSRRGIGGYAGGDN